MGFLHYQRPDFKRRLVAGEIPEWLTKHNRQRYITQAVLSFPYWVDRAELKEIQKERDRLTALTGIPHQIDHEIPICHPLVCGLTVPWNLQILTQHANLKKGGAWSQVECEQFVFNL